MENLKALAYELRENVIDMIVEGKAGHIGGDMSVMEILTEIYFDQMNISPENMDDPDRAPSLSGIRITSFRESR